MATKHISNDVLKCMGKKGNGSNLKTMVASFSFFQNHRNVDTPPARGT